MNQDMNALAKDKILEYHMQELRLAQDASDKRHILPIIPEEAKRILDVGCGVGQTLIACKLPDHVLGFGIDCDEKAVHAGQSIVPSNIQLSVASGESIPFQDSHFDFVIVRVSMPYMNINQAVGEIARVLRPGGTAWLVLHGHRALRRRVMKSVRACDVKDILYCAYVALNTVLVFGLNMQLKWRNNRTETFQIRSGMIRKFSRVGMAAFDCSEFPFFVMEAYKPRFTLRK